MVYFDNAATTFIKPMSVYKAVYDTMMKCASVGRGGYRPAVEAADKVFACREEISTLLCLNNPERVAFTMNATQSLNMAIKDMSYKNSKIIISGYEHNAVLRPVYSMQQFGVIPVICEGDLFNNDMLLTSLEGKLKAGAKLAVFTAVSNVFGYILPIAEIDRLCFKYGVPLIIDASQAVGCIKMNISEYKSVKYVCFPGHKGLYGPQGTGVIICLKEGDIHTLLEGGTGSNSASFSMPPDLPDRFEPGTQNVPAVAGLCEGVKFVKKAGEETIMKHEKRLLCALCNELREIPGIRLFCSKKDELQSGVLSFTVDGMDCEEVASYLADRNIAVRAGLHCAPLAHKSAKTFETGTVRVSFSLYNSMDDVKYFVSVLKNLLKKKKFPLAIHIQNNLM